jgi:hypothetical protein
MTQLTAPSKELAARLIAKLGYEGRLLGCQLDPWSGCNDIFLFSLEEAAEFLEGDLDILCGMNGFIRLIEPDGLKKWIESQFGDTELADSIADVMRESDACTDSIERYKLKIAAVHPIKDLLLVRLAQCREVLGEETKVKEVT